MPNMLDQSKKLSRKKSRSKEESAENPWDVAIAEAKQRIADFKFSIKVFEKKKQQGAPWLGLESEQQKSPQEGG